jgi:hypothetical protein
VTLDGILTLLPNEAFWNVVNDADISTDSLLSVLCSGAGSRSGLPSVLLWVGQTLTSLLLLLGSGVRWAACLEGGCLGGGLTPDPGPLDGYND